ncbi:unnamed protein product [Haemonchus placei]|uniref:Glycosyltransferase n=1 Tax=Haemonchus placei TaxID=6290 RepID=A0A0N4WNQ9_HAEPC|nr:unnamed protein product [Haemonchus placei]
MVTGNRMLIYYRQYPISGVPLARRDALDDLKEERNGFVHRVCSPGEFAEANVAVDHVVVVLPPPVRGK